MFALRNIFQGKKVPRPGFRQGFALGLAMVLLILGGALGFREAYEMGAASSGPSTSVAL